MIWNCIYDGHTVFWEELYVVMISYQISERWSSQLLKVPRTKLANAAYAMKLHEVLAARGSKAAADLESMGFHGEPWVSLGKPWGFRTHNPKLRGNLTMNRGYIERLKTEDMWFKQLWNAEGSALQKIRNGFRTYCTASWNGWKRTHTNTYYHPGQMKPARSRLSWLAMFNSRILVVHSTWMKHRRIIKFHVSTHVSVLVVSSTWISPCLLLKPWLLLLWKTARVESTLDGLDDSSGAKPHR